MNAQATLVTADRLQAARAWRGARRRLPLRSRRRRRRSAGPSSGPCARCACDLERPTCPTSRKPDSGAIRCPTRTHFRRCCGAGAGRATSMSSRTTPQAVHSRRRAQVDACPPATRAWPRRFPGLARRWPTSRPVTCDARHHRWTSASMRPTSSATTNCSSDSATAVRCSSTHALHPASCSEVEPLDPVAGHVPGAVNRPFQDNLAADGTFRSSDALRESFSALPGAIRARSCTCAVPGSPPATTAR